MDTNVIIEAVRTGCWPALTSHLRVETVDTCRDEARAGNPARPGYVHVTAEHLARLHRVHPVTAVERASLVLAYDGADGMDDGERDLFAHAHARDDDTWVLCSPDKASVRAAVTLGWGDRLRSLGSLAALAGSRPRIPLKPHFEEAWLVTWRTHFRLA
ncbi:MAG TPA: hypothetical protein VEX86_01225 [Longimicrobium sp.]|nr:hypothetical protein [Longimicrobium sp.]